MKIEVLGPGCPKCKKLHANALEALEALGLEAEVEKVADLGRIMGYGVVVTPALVVDGVVKSTGKVLSVEDLKKHLA